MKWMKMAALGLLVAVPGLACNKALAPMETHTTTGVIRDIQEGGKVLVIEHQAFPGWMEGMTMPFDLSDPKLGQGLKKGDKVEFTLSAQDGNFPITAIRKI
jgi:Cu/Ag efflux protein CusF